MDVTMMATSEPTAQQPAQAQQELYVVQRCWHSGPQQYAPMDFLRLFLNQRDAEEAAYHSAHAWCKYHRPDSEPQVKTLLLPSYPAGSSNGSSYGFIAFGSLFWVRALLPTIAEGIPSTGVSEGFAVVTEGIIGGTGNPNSRRGSEVATGRVFVGPSEVARSRALGACHHVMAQFGITHRSTNVVTLPIGKPTDYSSANFLKDWPPQVLQPYLLETAGINNENKRGAHNIQGNSLSTGSDCGKTYYGNHQEDADGVEVECPFEQPAAKRRRLFCASEAANATNHDWMRLGAVAAATATTAPSPGSESHAMSFH